MTRFEAWHDVYMTVLKAQLGTNTYNPYVATIGGGSVPVVDIMGAHERAKKVADLTYPPESKND